LTATQNGYGKRTPGLDYPIHGRGGQGVISIKTTARNGPVIAARLAREGDDTMFITESGMIVRTSISEISSMGRNTQGVRLVNLKEEDRLVSFEVVSESDLERFAEAEGEAGEAGEQGALLDPGAEEPEEPEESTPPQEDEPTPEDEEDDA
jgi:DNA gyrase subunit A